MKRVLSNTRGKLRIFKVWMHRSRRVFTYCEFCQVGAAANSKVTISIASISKLPVYRNYFAFLQFQCFSFSTRSFNKSAMWPDAEKLWGPHWLSYFITEQVTQQVLPLFRTI